MSSLAPAPSLFCPHHKSSTPRIVAPQSHIISTPSSAATATSSLAPPHSAFSSVDLHKLGIYTSLPTPASTPEFVNLSALRHSESPNSTDNDFTHVASCSSNLSTVHQQRPVHLRASTLPNVMDNRDGQDRNVEQVDGSTQSISAVEVVVLGAKREVQSGGPAQGVKMERFTSPSVAKKVAKVAGSESSKDRFVNGLVCACVFAIESIWGPSPTQPHSNSSVLPLHWFVKEVLRRSRTSCSTLQVALFYLHQIRRQIRHSVATAALHLDEFVELENALRLDQDIKGGVSPAAASTTAIGLHTAEMKLATATTIPEYPSPPASPTMMESRYAELLETQNSAILCGRRMFLAALISSSKYLQDRNYSNRAWSKISGLPALEINVNERMFLSLMEYQLFVSAESFQQWTARLSTISSLQSSRPVAPITLSPMPKLPSPRSIYQEHLSDVSRSTSSTLSAPSHFNIRPIPIPTTANATTATHMDTTPHFTVAPNGRRRAALPLPPPGPIASSSSFSVDRPIRSIPVRRAGRSASMSSVVVATAAATVSSPRDTEMATLSDSIGTYVQTAY